MPDYAVFTAPCRPGACMGNATSHHSSMAAVQQRNNMGLPQDLTRLPPSQPPTKKPSDCSVLYTPIAVPRTCMGARRETRLGWVASSTLKPQKNANSKPPSGHRRGVPEDTASRPTSTHAISRMAVRNTFLRWPRRSRANMQTINTNEPRSEEHTSELQSHHDLVCRL